jgi:hypothetical protein
LRHFRRPLRLWPQAPPALPRFAQPNEYGDASEGNDARRGRDGAGREARTRWFHPAALLVGWAIGMVWGTWMVAELGFKSAVYPLHLGAATVPAYAALIAFAANFAVAAVLTPVLAALGVGRGRDDTRPGDYELRGAPTAPALPLH